MGAGQYLFAHFRIMLLFGRARGQRDLQQLRDRLDVVQVKALQLLGRQVLLNVLPVVLGEDDVRYSRAFRGQRLLLIPPIGSTLPLRVISPVIAVSGRTRRSVNNDTSAVAIVTPADGPSLGIAPAGTWMWMS